MTPSRLGAGVWRSLACCFAVLGLHVVHSGLTGRMCEMPACELVLIGYAHIRDVRDPPIDFLAGSGLVHASIDVVESDIGTEACLPI